MREIKFRGRHLRLPTLLGDWIYGSLYSNGADDHEPMIISTEGEGRYYPVAPGTVGQFTGLKDHKGREIYEGDVVEFNDSWHDINGNYCEKMQRGYIKYDYGEFSIVTLCGEAFLRLLSTCVQSDTLIVIGNVHDNPELLEVEA